MYYYLYLQYRLVFPNSILLINVLHILDASCVNDDSSADSYNEICSDGFYENYPDECGDYDTDTFTASVQCCSCGGGNGKLSICIITSTYSMDQYSQG